MPRDFTMAELMNIIRNKLSEASLTQSGNVTNYDAKSKGLIVLVDGKYVPKQADKLKDVHDKYRDDDGFLYLQYTEENMYG